VKVDGGKDRRLYWRATILAEYTGVGWREALHPEAPLPAREVDFIDDPLLPAEALDDATWVKQEVVVGALSDNHLIASAQPVKVATGTAAPVRRAESGVVVLPASLRIGQRYTAWSYVSDAKLADLAKASGFYPTSLNRYLELVPGVRLPPWSARGRGDRVEEIFADNSTNFLVISHEAVYRQAREVVGRAKSPYAAALALEAWFRSKGGFSYDEQPPPGNPAEPPLVAFVLRSRAGYCQHYAGAMAVMLRLLGVPARVAAGFTSGTFDRGSKEWVVTDHNAHTWVEVYFPGYGWLPFDPTPGRGELGAAYSSGSTTFASGEGFTAPDVALLGRSAVLDAITADALRLKRGGLEGTGIGSPSGTVGGSSDGGLPNLVMLALFVLAGAVAIVLGLKRARRELRFATRDPRAIAGACRRDVAGFLADQGVSLPGSTTLEELGRLVEREFVVDAVPFVRSVRHARFGRPADAEEAARGARRELRVLRRQMRRELPAAARVRGAFSLRSLVV
jgi:transglutaminase-like putative cysteine protease